MAILINFDADSYVKGARQARSDNWDDAKQAQALRQEFVRTNKAEATQDSDIRSTNSKNNYYDSHYTNERAVEGAAMPGRLAETRDKGAFLTAQEQANIDNNAYEQVGVSKTLKNIADAQKGEADSRFGRNVSTERLDAYERGNLFKQDAELEAKIKQNEIKIGNSTQDAIAPRTTDIGTTTGNTAADTSISDNRVKSVEAQQRERNAYMTNAARLSEDDVAQLNGIGEDQATQLLRSRGAIGPDHTVASVYRYTRDQNGNTVREDTPIRVIRDAQGNVVPLNEYLNSARTYGVRQAFEALPAGAKQAAIKAGTAPVGVGGETGEAVDPFTGQVVPSAAPATGAPNVLPSATSQADNPQSTAAPAPRNIFYMSPEQEQSIAGAAGATPAGQGIQGAPAAQPPAQPDGQPAAPRTRQAADAPAVQQMFMNERSEEQLLDPVQAAHDDATIQQMSASIPADAPPYQKAAMKANIDAAAKTLKARREDAKLNVQIRADKAELDKTFPVGSDAWKSLPVEQFNALLQDLEKRAPKSGSWFTNNVQEYLRRMGREDIYDTARQARLYARTGGL